MERRRRWAASGRLPPALAARFTLAEQAVLALVAAETAGRGDCRLAIGHIAAITGVSETTVRNAIREARKLGLLTVEERQITGFRNDTNVVRIVSAEWSAWLRLARKGRVLDTHPLPLHACTFTLLRSKRRCRQISPSNHRLFSIGGQCANGPVSHRKQSGFREV